MPPELRDRLAEMSPDGQRDLERVWDMLGRGEPRALGAPGVEEAWADLRRRAVSPPARDRPPARLHSRRRVWPVVAALAAVVAVGAWMWHRPVVVTVPQGSTATVSLPDGSAVELNGGSGLRYRRGFEAWPFVDAETRGVALRGEAFFDVAPSGRPFVVETAGALVEVLGTQFNVRSRGTGAGRETAVTLVSGRVRVSLRDGEGGDAVLTEPGASAHVVYTPLLGPELVTRSEPVDPVLAWRRGGFAVVDRSLASILREVERHFSVDIDVESPLALADSMTVYYGPRASPEDVLHDLCLVHRCRFRPTSRGFAITAEPEGAPDVDA